MLPRLSLIREGLTALYVPEESLHAKEPKTTPAFFNPAAKVNRDISVAITTAARPSTFLDALAGVGARGIRIAKEVPSVEVTLVEFNDVSIEMARRSARKNQVAKRCEIIHQEANAFLHSRFGRLERFQAVDIDPFGTPAPYVQGALAAADDDGIVSITATDTATLCGVFPTVALRRYGARIVKSDFAHEAAIRVLVGFCARVGGTIDTAVYPVAAHSTLHYLRVYFRVSRGAGRSDRCLQELGYVTSCDVCHENVVTPDGRPSCPSCGGKARSIGPQWVGRLVDDDLGGRAAAECRALGWREAAEVLESTVGSDAFPPFGFSLESMTSREKVSSVRTSKVLDSLKAMGLSGMRQPFEAAGLKSDASYMELMAAVRESRASG